MFEGSDNDDRLEINSCCHNRPKVWGPKVKRCNSWLDGEKRRPTTSEVIRGCRVNVHAGNRTIDFTGYILNSVNCDILSSTVRPGGFTVLTLQVRR